MIDIRLRIMFAQLSILVFAVVTTFYDSNAMWNPFRKNEQQTKASQEKTKDQMMAELDSKKLHGDELLNFIAYRSGEHYLGCDPSKALVQVLIYGSMSCPHCGHVFLDIMPKLRKKYLDVKDSKVVFIHRSFVGDMQSMNGTQLLECKPNMTNDEYFSLLKTLYKEQMSWVYSNSDYILKLRKIGSKFSISTKMFDACMKSRELEGKIIKDRIDAVEKVGLRGTPMILINGKMSNKYEYRAIANEIDDILKGQNYGKK